jgi:glycosyltransferase involved in cell wall biosynthesis
LYEQEIITSYKHSTDSYTGVPIHAYPDLHSPDKIIKYLEEYRPSLIHIHYWGDTDKPWYEQIFSASERYGCKIIENINTPVEPFLSKAVEHYVYVSNYVYDTFGQRNEKSSVIYPGCNFDIFTSKKQVPPDNCIGMVYRLEKDKLNEQSIDVFIKVAQRRPETKVLIVGGGSYLEPYKNAVNLAGVTESFIFTDYVSYQSLPSLYEQMSIFVAPVWQESFGQVSPFAMNMGIVVVGYNIGALSEIIGTTELLAPPGDSDKLADIIIELLNNRNKRISIGAYNRERARKLYSIEVMVNSYKINYQSLLDNNNLK